MRKLTSGGEAIELGSLAAGCDAFFSYPTDISVKNLVQNIAKHYRHLEKTTLTAEDASAAVAMLYGAAATGLRVMTVGGSRDISLMQEGISCLMNAELPAVFIDVMSSGPGPAGNNGPAQGDYFQIVKGSGHGGGHAIVFAPNSPAEMYRMTIKAFELADLYRMPVFLLIDSMSEQIQEPIELLESRGRIIAKPWKLDTTAISNRNLVTNVHTRPDEMEQHLQRLNAKYKQIEEEEALAESFYTEGAKIILTGYGIVSHILKPIVRQYREQGVPVGMIRPQTLWPFPADAYRKAYAESENQAVFLTLELNMGQMIEDVKLSLPQARVLFHGRMGGNLPSFDDIHDLIRQEL